MSLGMRTFDDLDEAHQMTVIEVAHRYFERNSDEVFKKLRIAEFETPPEGAFLLRPELWKSYNWGWWAKIAELSPEIREVIEHPPVKPPIEYESPLPVFAAVVILGFILVIYYFMYYPAPF